MSRPRFSELLIDANLVSEEEIRDALIAQRHTGELIGSILFKRDLLTEEQVVTYLSKVFQVPGLIMSDVVPDPKLRQKIPKEIAVKYEFLPIKLEHKNLHVATVDPHNLQMIQEIEFMTGYRLTLFVAMQSALKNRMNFFYGTESNDSAIDLPSAAKSENMSITPVVDNLQNEYIEDLQTLSHNVQTTLEESKSPIPTIEPEWEKIPHRKTTVLVVDDDASIRDLLEESLKANNYNVCTASTGREGVKQIQDILPDLILLDAMLPQVHGFAICKRMKESEKYRHIPVIIITAVYTGWRFAMDVKEKYGADHVIEKPFQIREILSKVKELLDESVSITGEFIQKEIALARSAEEQLTKGAQAFNAGNLAEAELCFRKGLEIDQFHPILHYYIGKCAEQKKDLFAAMTAYEKAIEFDPYLFLATQDLAILYQKNGFKRKAIEMWERALQICRNATVKEKIKQNLVSLL